MKYVSNTDNVQVTYPSYLGRQILVLTFYFCIKYNLRKLISSGILVLLILYEKLQMDTEKNN